MKRKLILTLILIMTVLGVSGCGAFFDYNEQLYRMKQIAAGAFVTVDSFADLSETKESRLLMLQEGEYLTRGKLQDSPGTMRDLAFAWGEGDIKYHIQLPGDDALVTTTFSATTIAAYHYSYLINAPAKFVANLRMNFAIMEGGIEELAAERGVIEQTISVGMAITYTILDLLYLGIGMFLATILFPFVVVIGFLFNPIQTFLDIIPVVLQTFATTFYALLNFFY
jgi:hypothetical protein